MWLLLLLLLLPLPLLLLPVGRGIVVVCPRALGRGCSIETRKITSQFRPSMKCCCTAASQATGLSVGGAIGGGASAAAAGANAERKENERKRVWGKQ